MTESKEERILIGSAEKNSGTVSCHDCDFTRNGMISEGEVKRTAQKHLVRNPDHSVYVSYSYEASFSAEKS